MKSAEEGRTNSEVVYKIVFETIVANYNKLLETLGEIKKESEVAGVKYTNATKQFLEAMLASL